MRVSSNPMNRGENIISLWLKESGYKREEVAKLLRVSYRRLHDVLKHPKLLTGEQLECVTHATGRALIDVLRAVYMNDTTPQDRPQLWHEEAPIYGKA